MIKSISPKKQVSFLFAYPMIMLSMVLLITYIYIMHLVSRIVSSCGHRIWPTDDHRTALLCHGWDCSSPTIVDGTVRWSGLSDGDHHADVRKRILYIYVPWSLHPAWDWIFVETSYDGWSHDEERKISSCVAKKHFSHGFCKTICIWPSKVFRPEGLSN